jgi:hypothetical protein
MVLYFQGLSEEVSEDTLNWYIQIYMISIIIWPILCLYSIFRLKGKGNEVIDEVFESIGLMMLDGIGAMFHIFLPSMVVIADPDLGFNQRFGIIIFLILFWSIVLFYIQKVTKGAKRRPRIPSLPKFKF